MSSEAWKSCDRKRRYKNARQAHMAADRAARGQGRARERLRAYECEMCGGWHLTSQKGEH